MCFVDMKSFFNKTDYSPHKELYQVNTAGIEAAKNCTLLQVRE